MLEIYKCGTLVTIKLLEQKGIIVAINIKDNFIQYEISYFNNGEYQSVWMSSYEFDILNKDNSIMEIGFKNI